jgi:two-component sensor histidine kinase
MQAPIEQTLASNLNYLRVGLVSREARTVAYSPLLDELGQSTIGRDYADRPFIPVLKQSLKPMLSEVVIAKIGAPIPNVIALAPVVNQGEYSGYIAGILSLKQVNEFFEKGAGSTGLRYALVDKNSNVFITNIPSQKLMAPRDRSAGELTALQNGVAQWVPALAKGAPIMERWKSSMYVSESNIGQSGEWTLLLEQPVAPFQKQLSEGYAELLGLLLLILLGALALAELVSRRGIRSLETLSSMTKALPGRLTKGDDGIEWPRTNVSEIQQLVANFQEMAGSLSAQFKNVKQSNEQLELRVQERTASLNASLNDKEALIKEVHHRVKNNLQVITSLLRLESHRSNVDNTKSVLGDMHARIRAMALLHELLYRSGTFASVDLGAYLKQLATQAFRSQSTTDGNIQLELDLGSVQVGMDQAIPCGLLVNELISNCMKHGFPAGETGTIRIELKPLESPNQWCLRVSDTGVGLPENFEEKRKNSLGLQLVGDLARQISGALEITCNSAQGVMFTVNFAAIEPAPLTMPD